MYTHIYIYITKSTQKNIKFDIFIKYFLFLIDFRYNTILYFLEIIFVLRNNWVSFLQLKVFIDSEICLLYRKICLLYGKICLLYRKICLLYRKICLLYSKICLLYRKSKCISHRSRLLWKVAPDMFILNST